MARNIDRSPKRTEQVQAELERLQAARREELRTPPPLPLAPSPVPTSSPVPRTPGRIPSRFLAAIRDEAEVANHGLAYTGPGRVVSLAAQEIRDPDDRIIDYVRNFQYDARFNNWELECLLCSHEPPEGHTYLRVYLDDDKTWLTTHDYRWAMLAGRLRPGAVSPPTFIANGDGATNWMYRCQNLPGA